MAQQPQIPAPIEITLPVLQGQSVPDVIDTRRHLQLITGADGIALRLKDKVPGKLEAIAHWTRSLRSSLKTAKSGVSTLARPATRVGTPSTSSNCFGYYSHDGSI